MDYFFLDTYFFSFQQIFSGGWFFFLLFLKSFFCVFFLKEISKLCQTHLDQRTQRERGETERGGREERRGEREKERARPVCTSQEKKGTSTLFWNHKQKMHSSELKRLNQTPAPVYTWIYSRASRERTRAHAHTREHTHTHTRTGNECRKKNQNLKTLQNKWNTFSIRINKNLHKTRHILWVLNCVKIKTLHWLRTEKPEQNCLHVPSTQIKGKYCATRRMSLPQDTQLSII